jgi:serine protease SohB
MEYLLRLGLFAGQTFVIVVAIVLVLLVLISMVSRGRMRHQLEVEKLNNRYRTMRRALLQRTLPRKTFKAHVKKESKELKKQPDNRKRVFIVDFDGDMRATAVSSLREEITAILTTAEAQDEVVVRLESGGGVVHGYGLAASQLKRVRDRNIRLTICVDKIAASGGYMMACIGDRILAAPFAIVGSIGVIAPVANFHKVLQKHDVEYREVTSGQYKRTVSIFGRLTEDGLEKFKAQIEETHDLFKNFVQSHRPQVDLSRVGNGEHWFGTQALPLQLVDELRTSDDYLFSLAEKADLFKVSYHGKKKLSEKFSESLSNAAHALTLKLWKDLRNSSYGV